MIGFLLTFLFTIENIMAYTLVKTSEDISDFILAMEEANIIALDCEGVELSRFGTVQIVSIAVDPVHGHGRAFLFDLKLKDSEINERQVEVLKRVLENEDITKVMFDCHQDCDR